MAAAIDGATQAKTGGPDPALESSGAADGGTQPAEAAFSAELAAAAEADPAKSATRQANVDRQGDRAVVDAGDGNDVIRVSQNGERVTVDVNGERHDFTGREAQNLVIEGGRGNDRIEADASVRVGLSIEGGEGADAIRGGAGADYLNGSLGADTIRGSGGNDVLYGGDGNDQLQGEGGDDYVEGGRGDDQVRGNDGDDIVSGGDGTDLVVGGDGNDVLYAGAGKDALYGMSGDDVMHAERGVDDYAGGPGNDRLVYIDARPIAGLDRTIRIDPEASPEFRERFQADLALLQSSPRGRLMLEALVESGQTLTIQDSTGTANWIGFEDGANAWYDERTGQPGSGSDAELRYDPQRIEGSFRDPADPAQDWKDRPPIIGLYHELAHAYNGMTGTLQPGEYQTVAGASRNDQIDDRARNIERQAIGLPSTPPDAVPDTANPRFATENGLRDEMGLPLRPRFDYKEEITPRRVPGDD